MFKTNRNLNGLKGSRVLENKIRHVELQRSISPVCVQQEVCVSDSLNTLNSTVNLQPSASFVIGRWGQERGGAIVGDGPFEFYSSDLVQHVSSSTLGQLLRVLVLAGGWRSLGLVVSTVVHTGGLSLGSRGLELELELELGLLLELELVLLLLLLEQLLFLLLVQLLLKVLLLLLLQ